jgi:hypothetical protein
MLAFVLCILYSYIFAPIFRLPAPPLPPDLWDVIRIGLGGYVIGRSVEKVAQPLADAFVAKADINSKKK